MAMTSRSIYGCWTCRLRKKKCDENHPSCSKCTSLSLDCDGYGPRPDWMRRGDLESDHARKVKRIICQSKSNTRQHKSRKISQDVTHETNLLATRNVLASGYPLSDPAQDTLFYLGLESENNIQYPTRDVDSSIFSEPIWGDDIHIADFPVESLWEQEVCTSANHQRRSEISKRASVTIPSGIDQRDTRKSIEFSSRNTQPEANMEAMNPLYDMTLNSSHVNPIFSADVEDALFMYYFDHVFYIHCPFYALTSQRGRGWLFSILKRVTSTYHTALALSEYHQSTLSQHSRTDLMRVRGRQYDLALQKLQASLLRSYTGGGKLGLAYNIEVLTSILLLLFYELFDGGRQNWQIHLAAVTALVPPLVQAQIASITEREHHMKHERDRMTPRPDEYTSISFLLGFFISMDILSCASTRSSHYLDLDHKFMLERGDINLENLTGCSNWAMVFILEISSLDKWKQEEKKGSKLSMRELTKHGGEIEERLRKKLANIDNEPPKRAASGSNLGTLPDSTNTEITKIFALSAITYLHVVISGAYPELPEIRESVSKTLKALQCLVDPKSFRNVIWPFCITGCLAVDGQQDSFRELVSAAQITESSVGTSLEALEIMEQCWGSRKSSSCDYDWVCAMEKRGCHVLLA